MIKFFIIVFINFYRLLFSPFLGKNCRFETSCSKNMIQSLEKFGLFLGLYFGLVQIVCCSPWYSGEKNV